MSTTPAYRSQASFGPHPVAVGCAQGRADPTTERQRYAVAAHQCTRRVVGHEASDESRPIERRPKRRPRLTGRWREGPPDTQVGGGPILAQRRGAALATSGLFGAVRILAIGRQVFVVVEPVVAEELDSAAIDATIRWYQVTLRCVRPRAPTGEQGHQKYEPAIHRAAPNGMRNEANPPFLDTETPTSGASRFCFLRCRL